jgi:type IV secretion system protein VirD4
MSGLGFRAALLADLPRGVAGKADAAVATAWGDVAALGPEYLYGKDTPNGRRGVFLGYDGLAPGRAVGFADDRHVLTIAGSRGGKGRSLIVPNMLLYEGSALAIDPKGELACITSRAREEMGQKVYVLDPFGASLQGCETQEQCDALAARFASYNPLCELDPESQTFIDDAALIAGALVKETGGDSYWTDSAKRLLRALILFVFLLPEDEQNLCTVRDLLMLKDEQLRRLAEKESIGEQDALWKILKLAADAFEGVISSTAATFAAMADKEVSSVLSSARTQTEFLDSPTLRALLRASHFRLGDLKRGAVTVYLCLPAGRMVSHASWLRIVIDLALHAFEKEPARPPAPLLMVLDEFPVLGYMRTLEAAAGQIAGFGVKLWTVIQDVTQLKRLYKDSWETFVGNAGVITAFANTDHTTLRYLSDQLGKITMDIVKESGVSAAQARAGASATQKQVREDPLLAPHELALVFARDTRRVLVLTAGKPPLALQRAYYDEDANFLGRFDR